jgi:hypothetical protein
MVESVTGPSKLHRRHSMSDEAFRWLLTDEVTGNAKETARRLVSYLRVSTDKQGIRGLGMEAQQAAVERCRRC